MPVLGATWTPVHKQPTWYYHLCEVKQECIHSELISDGGLVLTTDLVHILESWVQGPCSLISLAPPLWAPGYEAKVPCREQATCKNNITYTILTIKGIYSSFTLLLCRLEQQFARYVLVYLSCWPEGCGTCVLLLATSNGMFTQQAKEVKEPARKLTFDHVTRPKWPHLSVLRYPLEDTR